MFMPALPNFPVGMKPKPLAKNLKTFSHFKDLDEIMAMLVRNGSAAVLDFVEILKRVGRGSINFSLFGKFAYLYVRFTDATDNIYALFKPFVGEAIFKNSPRVSGRMNEYDMYDY